ncbi:MAG: YdcF family protein [Flavobacterium sp.]
MNILLILLGSHIAYLLQDRVSTAVQLARTFPEDTRFVWFLSGGIKDSRTSNVSEAEQMGEQLRQYDCRWEYIYDIQSTNTAENMLTVNAYVNHTATIYDQIYVVTSQFHYERANQFATRLLSFTPLWVLGSAVCEDSLYWESIHMRNVDADIRKALDKGVDDQRCRNV